MNKEIAQSWLSRNLRPLKLIPTNSSRFKMSFMDSTLSVSMMGFAVDHRVAEGIVVEQLDEADCYLIKTGRTDFAFVDKAILREPLQVGAKVKVTPYIRREFNGYRVGEEAPRSEGGFTSRTLHIGKMESTLPFTRPKSYYLSNPSGLIKMLERGKCSDGMRVISNMLVDCKATDFQIVDTHWDGESVMTETERAEMEKMDADENQPNPEISFHVTTGKFVGRVGVAVDVGSDTFTVELRDAEHGSDSVTEMVHFDALASTLESLLDDGQWRFASVEIISRAKKATATA